MTDEEDKRLELVSELEGYTRLGEPDKAEKAYAWRTAIGLQQTDRLTPSPYLFELAKQNIEGHLTFDEVKERLNSYYRSKPKTDVGDRTKEADEVSERIAEIISEKSFTFSITGYTLIHKRLFAGIYGFAGEIRDYDMTKSEWVLNGGTVQYARSDDIRTLLWQEFEQEKEFSYKGLTNKQIAEHIARFVSAIWKIHAFGEGNTRTTAVFAIKYMQNLGFDVTNDLFSKYSWYFRNALVRANYNDLNKGIHSAIDYLYRFFGNLLLGENNTLRNRDMHVFASVAESPAMPVAVLGKEGEILKILLNDPRTTAAKLAEMVGLGERMVRNHLSSLTKKGLIRRIGSDKKGQWEIVHN